ncbi:related to metallo-beta-lactamase domain protein [Pseudozyma flocculosa]|uniref:Related to metallo-beta-lactamase domain protein n=1 Tax=Pseudozyma flocculosa TaxID=84751 RepID=A0A5C3FBJ1_9BASI|nr:related to metallo-beta-lactamase domain protein [Pseudozyma flocculosa]
MSSLARPWLLDASAKPASPGTAISSATPSTSKLGLVTCDPTNDHILPFFHAPTFTWTYLVLDSSRTRAVVIDPALDYDAASGHISSASLQPLVGLIRDRGYQVTHILETHVHADHLTGARRLKTLLAQQQAAPPVIGIGAGVTKVQRQFATRYGLDDAALADSFDLLLESDATLAFGQSTCRVMHLPGHTPDHVGYMIDDCLFAGDSIFMPDVGTARADFPGGSATQLAQSLTTLLELPDDTKVFVGHDYPPPQTGRPEMTCSTVAEQRQRNIHSPHLDGFVELRTHRDAGLAAPRLLHPSLQFNLVGGRLLRNHFVIPVQADWAA